MEINWHNALCLWRTHWCYVWWWGRFFNWHMVAIAMTRYVLLGQKSGTLGYMTEISSTVMLSIGVKKWREPILILGQKIQKTKVIWHKASESSKVNQGWCKSTKWTLESTGWYDWIWSKVIWLKYETVLTLVCCKECSSFMQWISTKEKSL